MIETLIWGWKPPKYEWYYYNTYRILFNPQPFEEDVTYINPETKEKVTETITRYKVYGIRKELPELSKAIKSNNTLEIERILLLEQIKAYDMSNAVNQFYINGVPLWIDKATRVGLNNSISKEIEVGRESTTLWYDTLSFTIPCQTAMQMLTQLEIYALDCYNTTAQHIANVKNAQTLEELQTYDYTTGYPDKLNFNI